MGKEVLVTIKGTRTDEFGGQETIEFVTTGQIYNKNATYYILYNESEASGMGGTTTSLKAEPNRVTLNRMGTSEGKHVFEAGVRHESSYITPYGSLRLSVIPSQVQVDLTETGGSINLKYELQVDRQNLSYNELSITVREV